MFANALAHWQTDEFFKYLKQDFAALELTQLPLSSCCNHSAVIDKDSIEVMILSSQDADQSIQLKVGVFFCEILSGCACSDDPSQAKILENSYCELMVNISKETAEATLTNAS